MANDREFNRKVGKKVKELRERNDMTQKYVANKLGITDPALSYIESGRNGLGMEYAEKLAKLFHVTVDDLYRDDDAVKEEFRRDVDGWFKYNEFLESIGIHIYTEFRKHYTGRQMPLDVLPLEQGTEYVTEEFCFVEYNTVAIDGSEYELTFEPWSSIKEMVARIVREAIKDRLELIKSTQH